MNKISPKNKEEYSNKGFTVVKDVFDPCAIDLVLSEINDIFCTQLKYLGLPFRNYQGSGSLLENMQCLLENNQNSYLSVARHIPKLLSIQQLTASPSIINICNSIGLNLITSPTSPVVHISSEQLKIKGGYFGVKEHQDWSSIQGGLNSVVLWVPFMDISSENYPLEVVAGSHLQGLISGTVEENSYTIPEGTFTNEDFERPVLQLGDALLMSVFTVHRSAVSNCKGFRIATSMRYESAIEETFVARGFPCAYQRTVNRSFITPDFPEQQIVLDVLSKSNI